MAKQIKYPYPQDMQEEKLTFIQRVIKVYQLFFWICVPFVVVLLPIIPAILFNEWYALFMIITFPVGAALFDFVTENKI